MRLCFRGRFRARGVGGEGVRGLSVLQQVGGLLQENGDLLTPVALAALKAVTVALGDHKEDQQQGQAGGGGHDDPECRGQLAQGEGRVAVGRLRVHDAFVKCGSGEMCACGRGLGCS